MSKFEDSFGVANCLDWRDRGYNREAIECDHLKKDSFKSSYKHDYCMDDTARLKRELRKRNECQNGKLASPQCGHHRPMNTCDRLRSKIIEECNLINEQENTRTIETGKDHRKKRFEQPYIIIKNDRFDGKPLADKKPKAKSKRSVSLNRTYSIDDRLADKEVKFDVHESSSATQKDTKKRLKLPTEKSQTKKILKSESTQTGSRRQRAGVSTSKVFGPLSNTTLVEEFKKISKSFRLKRKSELKYATDREATSDYSESKSCLLSNSSSNDSLYHDKNNILFKKRSNYDHCKYQDDRTGSEYSFKILPARPSKSKKKQSYCDSEDEDSRFIEIKVSDKTSKSSRVKKKSKHREYRDESSRKNELHELCKKCKKIRI